MALGLNRAKIGRKIALYAVICGLLGVTQFLAPASLTLGMFQSKLATKPVSGDIVVVGIDSDSINKIGRWPWPRDKQAELLQAIDNANPKSVFVDIGYQGVTDPVADATLRRTFENMNSPVTIAALAMKSENGESTTIFSHPDAVGNIKPVSVFFPYLFGVVWSLPYRVETNRGQIKSLSADIAGVKTNSISEYRLDLSYDPETIRILSASDVIDNPSTRLQMGGKTVVLGVTDPTQNDIHAMPGWGQRPGVLFHVIGAESLAFGMPGAFGFWWFFGAAIILCATLLTAVALRFNAWILVTGGTIILAASTGLTIFNISNDPLPAIALLICTGVHIQRQRMALARSQRNSETGFSDMKSYFVKEVISNAIFIGASIRIADTRRGLAQNEASPTVMKEVGRRLSAIIDERQITHNLQGQFLWESPAIATAELAAHLEGLKQLFAPSLLIDGRNVDIDIFFGIDRDVNSSIAIRSKRALDASREAMKDQSTFKIATTSSLENQLRSKFREEFEEAIANGDITIVFQAQKNLATNNVDSAEVCLRWTHPAHGHIPTTLIVDMASKSGNLELISILLCRNALEYNKKFNEEGLGYRLSAKISTAALQSGNFHDQLLKMTKHGNCSADMITLQIVDPKKAVSDERILAKIKMLKAEGFGIAIGNFGQTNDDLDMILAIKPNEIILARTFSRELLGSTSNSIYVDAALRIARAHNIITTAEDVEDRDILNELRGRGCDKAQGKIIAIPLHYKDFIAAHSPVRRANVG
jgi:EAL domain-containing protein (putative c-di-GMP-specific phosphodiesterase class I)/CHASE2 domain-containing sensor protein